MREAGRIACLSGAIGLGLLISSCSDPAAVEETDPGEPGAIKGVLMSGTADYFEEDRTEKLYALRRKDGRLLSLKFSGRPEAPTGSEVLVWGTQRGEDLYVERVKVVKELEGIGQQRSRITDNPPALTPPLRAAFVSLTPTYTKAMLDARLLRDDFITPIMDVSSYGRWTMTWQVFGPLTVPNDCGGPFYENLGKNGVAAMQAAGIDTTQFDQIQFHIGNSVSACSWGGFGLDGKTPIRTDGARGMYNPWSYVKNDGEGVMVQEIGHNWGLAHEHFCPNTQTPSSSPRCTGYAEYGSPFTPMSSSNDVYLNAWERIQMNFFSGCNVITIGTSGTYDIGPINLPCSGPQVMRIAADFAADATPNHQRYYYIEYRTPVGIERTNGVLVHYAADIKQGGWSQCDWGGPDCPEDFLINPVGPTRQTAALPAGTEWTTPQGVGIKIVSLGETAKFELTFPTQGDAPTCMDGTPYNNCGPVCRTTPANDGGTAVPMGGCPGDAGPGDATGGTGGSGGAGGSGTGGDMGTGGATAGAGGTGSGDDGCGCTVPGRGTPGRVSAFGAAAALAMVARWRRRSRSTSRS
jgi:MYXO-CTERM domain-containing protein